MDKKSKILHNSWRKWARTPPTRAKNNKNTELNGSGEGRKKGDIGWGSFVPVGATNRDQNPIFVPVGGSIRDHWSQGPLVPVGSTNRNKRVKLRSRLVALTGTKCPRDQWSRLGSPTGTNVGALVPVGGSNRDKRPLPPS